MSAVSGRAALAQKHTIRRPLVTIREAAGYTGLNERFVRRIVEERRIRFYKPGKVILLDPGDLDQFLAQSAVTATGQRCGRR